MEGLGKGVIRGERKVPHKNSLKTTNMCAVIPVFITKHYKAH